MQGVGNQSPWVGILARFLTGSNTAAQHWGLAVTQLLQLALNVLAQAGRDLDWLMHRVSEGSSIPASWKACLTISDSKLTLPVEALE